VIWLSSTSEVKLANFRYVNTRELSCLDNQIYDPITAQNQFPRTLSQWMDRSDSSNGWLRYTGAAGRMADSRLIPTRLLRLYQLAFLNNRSDRQVDADVNETLPANYFVGAGLDQKSTWSFHTARL
jgi:hypothetical protein